MGQRVQASIKFVALKPGRPCAHDHAGYMTRTREIAPLPSTFISPSGVYRLLRSWHAWDSLSASCRHHKQLRQAQQVVSCHCPVMCRLFTGPNYVCATRHKCIECSARIRPSAATPGFHTRRLPAAIPGSSVKAMTQGFVRASRILQKKHAESRYGMEVKYAWVKAAQATKATAKNPSPAKLAAAPIAGRSQRARMACCASAMAPSISATWITASPPK